MARRIDNTLLTQFGFNDPDRNGYEHDAACRYLSTYEVLLKLEARYRPEKNIAIPSFIRGVREVFRCTGDGLTDRVESERLLTKGKGDYRTTIGFLDVVIRLLYSGELEKIHATTGAPISTEPHILWRPLIIEVKIGRLEIGQILRQMNLYRTTVDDYKGFKDSPLCDLDGYQLVLATRFELDAEERGMLRDARIDYMRLGEGFTRYLEHSRRGDPDEGGDSPPVFEV